MCKNEGDICPKRPFCIIGGSIKQEQNSDIKVEQPNNNVICSKDTKTKQNNEKKKKVCKQDTKKCDKKCKRKDKKKDKRKKCKSPKKKCKLSKSECKQDNVANQDGTQAQACINDSEGTNITQDCNNPQVSKK